MGTSFSNRFSMQYRFLRQSILFTIFKPDIKSKFDPPLILSGLWESVVYISVESSPGLKTKSLL